MCREEGTERERQRQRDRERETQRERDRDREKAVEKVDFTGFKNAMCCLLQHKNFGSCGRVQI